MIARVHQVGTAACAAAVVCVLWAPSAARAGTYYVAPSGSDRGKGTERAPWQTLQHAVDRLAPGDTLIVKPGTYEGFHIRKGNSGTPKARVRILAQDGVVVDRVRKETVDAIKVDFASYVDIEGFSVTKAPRAGIAAVECQHVHIRNNKSYDNGRWGIFTGFCDDLIIENNVTSGSGREHGIYVSNSAKRPIIRGNRIFGNARAGIHTNGDASMGREGMTVGALIEHNIIYDNGLKGAAAINNDGIRDSIIRNNIIYNNHANGITIYRMDGKEPSTNNEVVHNTIVMPKGSRWCIRISDASTNNVFKNNICLNGHHYRGAMDVSQDSLPGLKSDNNILDGRFTLTDGDSVISLAQWRSLSGQDEHSVALSYDELSSIFVAPAEGDFRLKPGCAAVDKGDASIGLAADYAGRSRKLGLPDIGALEYCTGDACKAITTVAGPPFTADEAQLAEPAGAGKPELAGAGKPEPAGAGKTEPAPEPVASPARPPAQAPPSSSGCFKSQIHTGSPRTAFVLALLVLLVLRRRR